MPTNPEQATQDSYEDPLLSFFDLLYARTAERPAFTLTSDEQQEIDEAVIKLLAPLLLDPDQSKRKDSKLLPDGQRHLEQAHLVLSPEGTIKSFSIHIPDALGHPTIRVAGRPFSSLLTEASANLWQGLLAVLQGRICFHTVTALTLLSLHRQTVPALCTISKLLNSQQLQVSCLFVLQHLPPESNRPSHNKNSRNDAPLQQQLHDLILQHLDRPLPTIQQLARTLGTNTFTLKDGFRHYFNMGIHQFYTQERLSKAKLLLLDTNLPLVAIAEQCGFGGPSNFSKAFKKKYGMAPLPFKKARQKT